MGEQVSWIPWQIVPGDSGWDRLLDMLAEASRQGLLFTQVCESRVVL